MPLVGLSDIDLIAYIADTNPTEQVNEGNLR